MTINSQGAVAAYDDYYPFACPTKHKRSRGEIMPGRSSNTAIADAKYKFTGKERDVETGLDYFGARYYDSWRGQWLSVDPSSEKYPSLSPYVYSADNPITLLDIDGKKWIPAAEYAYNNLVGLAYGSGLSYGRGGADWSIANPNLAECNEIVARAYRGDGSDKFSGSFGGRMADQVSWFDSRGWLFTDRSKAEKVADVGDVLYYGDFRDNDRNRERRHEAIITGVTYDHGVKKYNILYAVGHDPNGKPLLSKIKGPMTFEELERYFNDKNNDLPFAGLGSVQLENADNEDASGSGVNIQPYGSAINTPTNYNPAADATGHPDYWDGQQ